MYSVNRATILAAGTCLILLLLSALPAQAAIIAVTFPDAPNNQATLSNDGVFGWQFTVNAPITVATLGWFDGGSPNGVAGNGLIHSHDVGLWDSSQNLLASTTIPAGTAALLNDNFRYVAISPLLLLPGSNYVIAGTHFGQFPNSDDHVISLFEPRITAGEVNYVGPRSVFPASGLTFPLNNAADTRFSLYFGPNFEFESAAVPEPASLLVWSSLSLLGLAYSSRHRRLAPGS